MHKLSAKVAVKATTKDKNFFVADLKVVQKNSEREMTQPEIDNFYSKFVKDRRHTRDEDII